MVLKKLRSSDVLGLDTRKRIMETAMNLFALKGFDGCSIREIAKIAKVNVASVNYHFMSKDKLRQEIIDHIKDEFKAKIASIKDAKDTVDFTVKLFENMTQDQAMCVNQFKLILEADAHICDNDPYPVAYEQFSVHLAKELNPAVPEAERFWLVNVVFCYVIHTAVMSSTKIGSKSIEKFLPNKRASIPAYIGQLVETLIRDLNNRYPR